MNDAIITDKPLIYDTLLQKSEEIGFSMPSDLYIGTLLKTLISAKPKANVLELGTGIGLSLAWMLEGLDAASRITSIDNDPELVRIVNELIGEDPRLKILCQDGGEWIKHYQGEGFDLIFADAWPGKYYDLAETLALIKVGGFYVIDDMRPQPNWPEGHHEKASALIAYLEGREDFSMTKIDWSTGVVVMARQY